MRLAGAKYLDRAKYPQDQSLKDNEGSRTNTEREVDADVLYDIGVVTRALVDFGPFLQPYTAACVPCR